MSNIVQLNVKVPAPVRARLKKQAAGQKFGVWMAAELTKLSQRKEAK